MSQFALSSKKIRTHQAFSMARSQGVHNAVSERKNQKRPKTRTGRLVFNLLRIKR